ncbi:MAG: GNAT family N-acetyltransferase [Chloroflexi bacterium]|nr:GNAT family N-acetyltransferase [Chloroflexota bacterium]
MKYTFVPMNQEYASTIVDTWKYEKEYSIYNYSNEADHMLDEQGWGRGIFAVLNQEGDLIGELSIEFFDAQGQYTEYCNFDDEALLNERELWIGFGLRPDLVGQGLGVEFVLACVKYAIQNCHYRGEYIRLGVAMFNQRAIKTYEKAGFQKFEQTVGEISGNTFECAHMCKSL